MRCRLTGVSRGGNLTAIRHRYPRIRDYVRFVRDYHRYERRTYQPRINDDPVLASFAANDFLFPRRDPSLQNLTVDPC